VASISRRPKPNWKSAAMEKPLKTAAERGALAEHEGEDERGVAGP